MNLTNLPAPQRTPFASHATLFATPIRVELVGHTSAAAMVSLACAEIPNALAVAPLSKVSFNDVDYQIYF